MAQHLGYGATFLTSAILAAAAMFVVVRLPIPRRATKRVPEPEGNEHELAHMRVQPKSSR